MTGDMFDIKGSEDDREDIKIVWESKEEVKAENKKQEVSDKEVAKILKRQKNHPDEEISKKKANAAEYRDSKYELEHVSKKYRMASTSTEKVKTASTRSELGRTLFVSAPSPVLLEQPESAKLTRLDQHLQFYR